MLRLRPATCSVVCLAIFSAPLPAQVDGGAFLAPSATLTAVPLGFLENRGQWDNPARFIATKGDVRVFVEPHALTVAVRERADHITPPPTRFVFEGASESTSVEGREALPGRYNHYVGGREPLSVEGLTPFAQVLYRDLYTGIDVRLRESACRLEYDVLLAPGATLSDFVVRCEGIERLEVADDKRLLMHTASGLVLEQSVPVTWAVLPDGGKRALDCRYVVLDDQRYGFEFAQDVAGLPVVIDPGLEWSTFVGGTGVDFVGTVLQDAAGRILVSGMTSSTGWSLPGVGAPFSQNMGGHDCFVALLDPSAIGAAQVVWWSYFGGSAFDRVWDSALNSAGQVFVVGTTQSPNFPVTAGASQPTFGGGSSDAYVVQFDPVAGTLVHATYFGGAGGDVGYRILLEEPATVFLAGATTSPDLPTTAITHDATLGGGINVYLAQLDLAQNGAAGLLYATYLGGSAQEASLDIRQVDITRAANGVVTIAANSFSLDFPVTPNAYQATRAASLDLVIAELDLTLTGPAAIVYGTYFGTAGSQTLSQMEADAAGALILTGNTNSGTFPTTVGAPFTTFIGPLSFGDAFLMKFDRRLASPLVYSTYIATFGVESFYDLEVAPNGTVFGVGSFTAGGVLPVTCGAFDEGYNGGGDGFILALTPAGRGIDDLHYLTYFGGSGEDWVANVHVEAVSGTPRVLVVGGTYSANLPTTAGALQTGYGGNLDGYIARLRLNPYHMCAAQPNSVSAAGARLCGTGSTTLASNALDLNVTELPPQSLGYFLMSTSEAAASALPAPSQGLLCLGAPQLRFSLFVQNAGATGSVAFRPDLLSLPLPGVSLSVGDTAYFQYWYRDAGGTSNTSGGVAVTFD